MREGYIILLGRSVCVSVCLSVCLSTFIIKLQAAKRHVNGTLVFSETSPRKMKSTEVQTLGAYLAAYLALACYVALAYGAFRVPTTL